MKVGQFENPEIDTDVTTADGPGIGIIEIRSSTQRFISILRGQKW